MRSRFLILLVMLSLTLAACQAAPAAIPATPVPATTEAPVPTATARSATALPPTATRIATPEPVILLDWQPANTTGAAFAGALGWFCHGINVGQDRLPDGGVLISLLDPEGEAANLTESGILAWGEVLWPATTSEITDLDALANEGLRPDACTLYENFWPETLSGLSPTEASYYTGIARLLETEDGRFWQVRVALVDPEHE